MFSLLDDAFQQELTIAAACAGERDKDEKWVRFLIS
jgi:hypothetical protein